MSTLVNILLAAVLNLLSVGEMKTEIASISQLEITQRTCELNELNPHFIITKDEMLSHLN